MNTWTFEGSALVTHEAEPIQFQHCPSVKATRSVVCTCVVDSDVVVRWSLAFVESCRTESGSFALYVSGRVGLP